VATMILSSIFVVIEYTSLEIFSSYFHP